jgi:DNA mismatch repair protein MLH1
MIDEYFSVSFGSGSVQSIPLLLKGYTPNLDRLPHLLLCLATRVDWEDERECFETFLRELAFFYSPRPFGDSHDGNKGADGDDDTESSEEGAHQLWQLEHVLFPAFRRTLWPRSLSERDVSQVANLPDLFRVFERC